jgi:octaprenyl-diphosphate synthase
MTLEEIFRPIGKELQLVEEQLRFQLKNIDEKQNIRQYQKNGINRLINHLFKTSGKRLRPALVLLSAKLSQSVDRQESLSQALIQLATTVELIHSASLIHDDVLDNEQYRRDQLSLNEKYGNKIAVLVGDILFAQAFSMLLNLEVPDWQKKQEIIQIFCTTIKTMCIGEIRQHQIISDHKSAELDEYLLITENKTARLMSACCQAGAMLTETDGTVLQNLANFGLHFGMAFQLADDFKDKDSLLNSDLDIKEITQDYIKKAKANLQPVNANPVTKHIIALCDSLYQ